ncbi:ABC transporter ATP-binding protein [Sulfitobacter donghicola]|uniref:Glutathione import ATP-binding protein GsiA n=1 Tax=Sulfitobacter donghicola DSW-25 = KCTC 12864 = JCM 14565 TaxID=1300350 RepID=A0A073IUL6_9RHOB|nr:ABC transporter ATP-binding protein [Sulfitobacter donghicola]KEJ89062.1 glutathione ABC transporter ATP-binding protein [Sulfitobacter donghicola DSW-25 = KCTC 12864 = JCM 14565]KIN67367.1 Oligopeptide/dipeptide ABC transporter, ATP-binding protein [Sulfitobacter donghicola DSW-25 = KCTC 12864 = JCM 14565]
MPDITASNTPLLSVRDLSVTFGEGPTAARVVDGVSFDIAHNRTLAIVGESGSGKSITSLAVLGLLKHLGGRVAGGEILFQSDVLGRRVNLDHLTEAELRKIRGNEIAMIFQEPMTSLNPVYTIGSQMGETLALHQCLSRNDARKKAQEFLDLVRLPNAKRLLDSYPHQLSGGMRQRVMIAMALCCQPKILIADEPTTALDVTIQAQILHIIRDLQAEMQTSVIFISHDMGVVSEMADDVLVMKASKPIEAGGVTEVLSHPKEPYTQELLAAVPRIGSMTGTTMPKLFDIPGQENAPAAAPAKPVDRSKPVLEIEDLTVRFDIRGGLLSRVTHRVHAAEKLSFNIYPGETLALVGESGSGKSTVGKTIQQLQEPVSGAMRFHGQDIFSLPTEDRKAFRKQTQYVFQDPYGSLNPRKPVGESLIEPALVHGLVTSKAEAKDKVADLLVKVGLPAEHAGRYPHQFSGGQRQRLCIARALACDPSLIIADEAVSALDVSVQAQVVNLLMQLQAEQGLSYLFITHDMAVVERISHRVAVMYLGQIVEIGSRQQVFENPQHPYTKRLLSAVPVLNPGVRPSRPPLEGEIPSGLRAVGNEPAPVTLRAVSDGHFVAAQAS